MTMNALKRYSILALVVLASLAAAQDKKTLRLTVKPGTVMTSTSVTDNKFTVTGFADQTGTNKTTMVQKTGFDAGTEGWLKFNIETTDFKVEGDQMQMGGSVDPAQVLEMAKKVKISGEVSELGTTRNVALSGDDGLDMAAKQAMSSIADRIDQIGLMSMFFPKEEIGVGSTWQKEIDLTKPVSKIPGMTNASGKAPVVFTVEAFEKVGDKDTVKVKVFTDGKVAFTMNVGQEINGTMAMTSKGDVWIDLASGLPVKSDTKMAFVMDLGSMANIQQEMSISSTTVVKS